MSKLKAVMMTSEEAELITAYRLSDARGKQTIMDYARGMSEDWPEPLRGELATEDASGGEP